MEELKYDKWMDILLFMDDTTILGKNPNMTLVTYELGITHSHVCKIFHILEVKELISTIKNGRTRYITVLPKGHDIAQHIRIIKKILEE